MYPSGTPPNMPSPTDSAYERRAERMRDEMRSPSGHGDWSPSARGGNESPALSSLLLCFFGPPSLPKNPRHELTVRFPPRLQVCVCVRVRAARSETDAASPRGA